MTRPEKPSHHWLRLNDEPVGGVFIDMPPERRRLYGGAEIAISSALVWRKTIEKDDSPNVQLTVPGVIHAYAISFIEALREIDQNEEADRWELAWRLRVLPDEPTIALDADDGILDPPIVFEPLISQSSTIEK
jgi:hypothetical protein